MIKPILLLAGLALAPPALAAPPNTPEDISIFEENGQYIARTSKGTLPIYTFDNDPLGSSTCYGLCAERWPPVIATPHVKAVGDWTLILRSDGTGQWAYKGKPLYRFAGDKPARPEGNGMGGVWHLLPAIPPEAAR